MSSCTPVCATRNSCRRLDQLRSSRCASVSSRSRSHVLGLRDARCPPRGNSDSTCDRDGAIRGHSCGIAQQRDTRRGTTSAAPPVSTSELPSRRETADGRGPAPSDRRTTGIRRPRPAAISACARLMLPVSTMSFPGCDFSAVVCSTGSPASTVEFSHCGSLIVDDTTYLATRLRYSVTPVGSSVCFGQ